MQNLNIRQLEILRDNLYSEHGRVLSQPYERKSDMAVLSHLIVSAQRECERLIETEKFRITQNLT